MKKLFLLFAFIALLPEVGLSQATYGKITPLGGVTASIGQELTFNYTALSGATYYWSAYPSVASIPSSSIVFTTTVDTKTIKVKFLEPMVAFLCVTRYKAGTQPAMECISFNVVNCGALPTPASLTGPTPISYCGSYTYTSATVVGATGYQWSGFVTGDKQTIDPEITISGSDLKLGSNSLKVKALNECGGSGSYRSKTVTVNGIGSPISISGPETVLLSGTATSQYTTTSISQAVSYTWYGFASGEKSTTGPTITVSPSDLVAGANIITVKAVDACDNLSAGAGSITVEGLTLGSPTSISGPTSIPFCGNATYTTDDVPGAAQYVWSGFSTGNKITTTPNVNVQWVDFTAGSRTLTVVAQDDIGNSNGSASIIINIPTYPFITNPAGNLNPDYCSNSTYTVSPYPGATEYVWSIVQSGYTTTTTSNNVTFNFANWGTFGVGRTVTVFARSCVNSNISSITVTPQINLTPISGPSTVGCSGSGNYSISPVCNAINYRWRVDGVTVGITTSSNINLSSSEYNGLVTVDVRAFVSGKDTNPVTKQVDFTCPFPFGSPQENSQLLTVSPNPASDNFTISDIKPIASPATAEVRVLREDGRLVKAYTTASTSISIEDLSLDPGLYVIEIRIEGRREFRKVLIAK